MWIDAFPALASLDAAATDRLARESSLLHLQEGTRVFGPGMTPQGFMLLLEGVVRVQKLSENGREIVLYRIHGGESCALTTACLLGHEDYQAEAVVEQPVRAVAIPRILFDTLIAESADFRQFVFAAFGQRVTDLLQVIDEVAFARLDIRLAQRLLELADGSDLLALTHQRLAAELGSAREVIGRQLGEFQRRGWVEPGRGSIRLLDREALERLARSR